MANWMIRGMGIGSLVLLGVCYGLLAMIPDLRALVPRVLGLTALVTVLLSLFTYGCQKQWKAPSAITLLVVAAGLRLLFLFDTPQLSDDLYRYLFDGSRLLKGDNPYALSPDEAAQLNPALADLVANINHRHLITIYPPGAQLVFAVGALGRSLIGVKLVLVFLDLVCIALIMRLLSHLGRPLHQVLIYAWHPLPVLEIASSGHIDGVALMLMIASLCLLWPQFDYRPRAPSEGGRHRVGAIPEGGHSKGRQRWQTRGASSRRTKGLVFWSGFLFSVAIWVKFFPVVFLPLCFLLVPVDSKINFVKGLVVPSLLLVITFLPDIANLLGTLRVYSTSWEFSGLAFRILRDGLSSGIQARIVLGVVFIVFWLYLFITTAFWVPGAERGPQDLFATVLKANYRLVFAFLLLTPTLHPWYGLHLLVFLPFHRRPAGIILSWSITLGYRVLIPYYFQNQWIEADSVGVLIWAGPLVALLLSAGIALVKRHAINSWSKRAP